MVKGEKPIWNKELEPLLHRNPGLRLIDDPEKLEYYRQDLNVDLPVMIRDLMLKSLPDLIFQPFTEEGAPVPGDMAEQWLPAGEYSLTLG
jgi:hypothetical protein